MNTRTLETLEFPKILDMLAERCVSPAGAQLARALQPYDGRMHAEHALSETREAYEYIAAHAGSPIAAFEDIGAIMDKARIGSTLSPAELLRARLTLSVSRGVKRALMQIEDENSILRQYGYSLVALKNVEDTISMAILSEEEVADSASPELADIRRRMRACTARVRDRLNAMLHSANTQKMLQDPIITIRGGRYVLPVRQEYRSQLPGLVHDQSASGATVYVEPMAVVEINNELRELQSEERAEIERILAQLTAMLAGFYGEIYAAGESMAALDFAFAKAELALGMDATCPNLVDTGIIRIRQGRHPLIPAATVVPVDLWLGEGFSTLVITGPNTGGKTVSLKLCGLMCMMAQSGLYVPAASDCVFPVFDDCFADIGDEQSIEQSLSTFSSHMVNIVSMLGNVTPNSLVLLDELGAGTDPTEGAALAVSLLEYLTQRGIRTMATTHYSELKAYALTTPGVENASMEFDVDTLRPTYRLTIGLPGRSNAFEISRRLGIPDMIIDRARTLLSSDTVRFEEVIASAEKYRQTAERELEQARQERQDMEKLRRRTNDEWQKFQQQRDKIIEDARAKASDMLKKSRLEADEMLRQMRRAEGQSGSQRDRTVQAARDRLRGAEADIAREDKKSRRTSPPPEKLLPGESVKLLDIDKVGSVLTPPNDRGEVQVQVGIMKMNTHITNLERTETPAASGSLTSKKRGVKIRASISPELDIRGEDTETGMIHVDRYIDDAVVAGLNQVQIIHGKGSGLLRDAVWRLLRRHPHVESFRLGVYGEGENGVTVVTLK